MKPSTEAIDRLTPGERVRLLVALETHPGFHLYCARHAEMLTQEIEARIFDPATTDGECRILRETRKRLVEQYTPSKIIEKLVAATENEDKRAREEAERARRGGKS